MTKSHIALYGHFGSGNIGNDSSLEAMIYNIRKYSPSSDITCICTGPENVAARYGIKTLPMDVSELRNTKQSNSRLVRIIKRIFHRIIDELIFWNQKPSWFKTVDQFIVAGTGAVDDMAVRWPWNAPYDLFKWCTAAKMGGAKVVFLSVGAGPIMNRISRILMLKALRMADYRSYREFAALDYLQSVNFNTTDDGIYPDLVFSLPPGYKDGLRKISSRPICVGIGVINYYGWRHDHRIGESVYQNYFTKVKQFVFWLLENGYTVRLIYGDTTDQRPVDELVEELTPKMNPEQRINFVIDQIPNVSELFRQLAQVDILVASRFHNVLCALMLERPVISLGYHRKNLDLMTDMGLEAYCQHIEEFTFDKLLEQFNNCRNNSGKITDLIHAKLAHYQELLDEQYQRILLSDESVTT